MDPYDEQDSLSDSSDVDEIDTDSYDRMTVLEAEQKRRSRLLRKLELQAKAPPRPVITESLKLRVYFQSALSEVLRPAK